MATPSPTYRLGIDLGTTSLGWCALKLESGKPSEILAVGVRIFSDGRNAKDKQPLAVTRRDARSHRRRIQRFKRRRRKLLNALIRHGLMPENELSSKSLQSLNPYEIRAKALDEKIHIHHLGRALFHINQRRGFLSNRKTGKKEKNELGAIRTGINRLKDELAKAKARTLGELLYLKQKIVTPLKEGHSLNPPIRTKAQVRGNSVAYAIYPERAMYRHEVEMLFESQKKYYPDLANAHSEIEDIIFFQRPLKKPIVGKCSLEPAEERIPKADPLFQSFRIHQTVNHLELRNAELAEQFGLEQKKILKHKLRDQKSISFGGIRSAIWGRKARSENIFNFEGSKKDKIEGDITVTTLSDQKLFGPKWATLSSAEQAEVIKILVSESDEREVLRFLTDRFGFDEETASRISEADIEEGYCRLSRKAIEKLLPYLEKGLSYAEARQAAGYFDPETSREETLPYYGKVLESAVLPPRLEPDREPENDEERYGKINNPTVHIGLNQLRKLVNALIERYGKPAEIVIELARDLKLSEEERRKIDKEQRENQKKNELINDELDRLQIAKNYENRMIYKVWESLATGQEKRCCPYTGKTIGLHDLFNGEFEVDHIIPFAQSYNDGIRNKVVVHKSANRYKGNRTPSEAFGHNPENYDWQDIISRIEGHTPSKQWAFRADCLQKLQGAEKDLIARQLHDTQYLSRMAKKYLSAICSSNNVWAIPGRFTAMLRNRWGLDAVLGNEGKNRSDHRHHAIDAFIVACTSRGMLQAIAGASNHKHWQEWRMTRMPDPMPQFDFMQFKKRILNIVVSHKPDHRISAKTLSRARTAGALHEETAMGRAGPVVDGEIPLVQRVPLTSLEKLKHIEEIRDKTLRERLLKAVEGLAEKSNDWKSAVSKFGETYNIRSVRLLFLKTSGAVVGFSHPNQPNDPYKYYALGNNYCAEIFCPNKGDSADKWQCEIIPMFWIHQKNYQPGWKKQYPTAKLVCRLFIHDMVCMETDGACEYYRVKLLSASDRKVEFIKHFAAQEDKKMPDLKPLRTTASNLQLKNLRKISVDILGTVKDPRKSTWPKHS